MSRYLALALGLCWIATSLATPPRWPTPHEFQRGTEQFAYDRLNDTRHLLLGPQQPTLPPVAPNQTCAELYARRLTLMQSQYNYVPPYTDDPRNRAAVMIGTVFNPALFYLAFTGIQAYAHGTRAHQTDSELDALRYASAEQQCYVQ